MAVHEPSLQVAAASTIDWDGLIGENMYINKKKESCKDEHSFCTLVDVSLTQSQNITLGICMEKLIHDVIAKYTCMTDISERASKKGERQTDHIWLNKETQEIIYAEQKNNINLDTEKCVSTETKVVELAAKYPGYKVSSYILATRYLSIFEPLAQKIILLKYRHAKVIGINDYLSLFGLHPFEDYDSYKRVINNIVKTKFVSDS